MFKRMLFAVNEISNIPMMWHTLQGQNFIAHTLRLTSIN